MDEAGSPALATSNERKVYDAHGKLLYDDTWYSHYRGEYKLVRVGSKLRPKPKPKTPPATTGTGTVTTTAPRLANPTQP